MDLRVVLASFGRVAVPVQRLPPPPHHHPPKQGMRWKWANTDAVVAVRMELLNQAWDGVTTLRLAV